MEFTFNDDLYNTTGLPHINLLLFRKKDIGNGRRETKTLLFH